MRLFLTFFAALLLGAAPVWAVCGDGLLDAAESCTSCPADCAPKTCEPGRGKPVDVTVSWQPPRGITVSSLSVRLGYRANRVSVPIATLQGYVADAPAGAIIGAQGLGYAVKVGVTRAGSIEPGRLFRLELDRCGGAPAPQAGDFACAVEGCASSAGDVPGCTCSAELTQR